MLWVETSWTLLIFLTKFYIVKFGVEKHQFPVLSCPIISAGRGRGGRGGELTSSNQFNSFNLMKYFKQIIVPFAVVFNFFLCFFNRRFFSFYSLMFSGNNTLFIQVLVDDFVDRRLLVTRSCDNVLVVCRNITT